MQPAILTVSGALTVAAIVAIVTLAFKDAEAYFKLFKVLVVALAGCAVGYLGYALGSGDGGKSAIEQIKSGIATDAVSTLMPSWPLGVMGGIFAILVTLTWFPDYLGFKGKNEGDKKLN